jgi:PTH1 family peptidyl-tRNA hydrolase
VSTVRFKGRHIVLLKPSTYMNLSGKAIRYWMDTEKIPVERVVVITDDLNLPFGTLRLRAKGSDGGHNGLKDIQAVLGTTVYPRLRFGIGAEFGKGQQVDYVLGTWSSDEQARMDERLTKAGDAVLNITTAGLARAMNTYNGQ